MNIFKPAPVVHVELFFLQELQAHYDEVQRQLQVTLDQLGISQRRLQSLTAELEEVRGNYESVSKEIDLVRLTQKEIDRNTYSRSLASPAAERTYEYYIM